MRRLFDLSSLRRDLGASAVVFLIAIPLSLGVAIASNAPPMAGLLSAIIGGLLVGFLAGAPLQISGPTAAVAVVVWGFIERNGWGSFGIATVVAGGLLILAGALRLGEHARSVPVGLMRGLLAGIGVLIAASQVHVLLGARPQGSGLADLAAVPDSIGSAHFHSVIAGLLTLGVLMFWRYLPRRLRALPAHICAVAVGIAYVAAAGGGAATGVQTVGVPAGGLLSAIAPPLLPDLGASLDFLSTGFLLAFIISTESLLSASAGDRMQSHAPRANLNRELVAVGVGNLACGILGALPLSGVIVRTGVNVEAGARTRASAIFQGLWLLLIVGLFPSVLAYIPLPCLAALLLYSGLRLIAPASLLVLWRVARGEVLVWSGTLVGVVAVNVMAGVGIGFALALLRLVWSVAHFEVEIETRAHVAQVRIHGVGAFIRLAKLDESLRQVPRDARVELDTRGLFFADHTFREHIDEWLENHPGGFIRRELLDASRGLSLAPAPIPSPVDARSAEHRRSQPQREVA